MSAQRLEIRPFSSQETQCRRSKFDCGHREINHFIKSLARKQSKRGEVKVFCLHPQLKSDIYGFYSLQLGTGNVSDLPDSMKTNSDYVRSLSSFPAIYIPSLGVRRDLQGRGLGRYLLADAIQRCGSIAKNVGFYALTLRSFNDASTAFYEKMGFCKYTEEQQPMMLLPRQSIVESFQEPSKDEL